MYLIEALYSPPVVSLNCCIVFGMRAPFNLEAFSDHTIGLAWPCQTSEAEKVHKTL